MSGKGGFQIGRFYAARQHDWNRHDFSWLWFYRAEHGTTIYLGPIYFGWQARP